MPDLPSAMCAVLLTGHGGLDALEYREDVPVPRPGPDDVLIRVAAAGVNNTDVNTRIGWYARSVTSSTEGAAPVPGNEVGGWSGSPIEFPRIQGADACGEIVAVGIEVDPDRVGERVLVATMQPAPSGDPDGLVTLGSELDGAFAQYLAVRSTQAYRIDSDWSDVELASLPCAYSTAENMLHRIGLAEGERVLVTGASGGVGSAAVQLAGRRGAEIVAVAGAGKADAVRALGAHEVIDRDGVAALGADRFDAVVDLVAGPRWPELLDALGPRGRLVTAGAIAGPIVDLDVRTLYLKDLTLVGATRQAPEVFPALVDYIERDEIRPVVHATYPLADIARAQTDFGAKGFVGKLVLVPPS